MRWYIYVCAWINVFKSKSIKKFNIVNSGELVINCNNATTRCELHKIHCCKIILENCEIMIKPTTINILN